MFPLKIATERNTSGPPLRNGTGARNKFLLLSLLVVVVLIATIYPALTERAVNERSAQPTTATAQPTTADKPDPLDGLGSAFQARKGELLAQAKFLVESGKPEEVFALLEPLEGLYDPDVMKALDGAQASSLRELLDRVPADAHEQRYDYLMKLAALLPNDEGVTSELAKERANHEKADAAREQEKSALERLSISAFCSRFRRRPNDPALLAAFEARGGRGQWASYIVSSRIAMGMNEFEVRCAWGPPNHVNRTVYAGGIEDKQMIYGDSYVYLENGVMTSLQD